MFLFKCKHPFEALHVLKDSTETPVDSDFVHVHHHYVCSKCGEELTKRYARVRDREAFWSARVRELFAVTTDHEETGMLCGKPK